MCLSSTSGQTGFPNSYKISWDLLYEKSSKFSEVANIFDNLKRLLPADP